MGMVAIVFLPRCFRLALLSQRSSKTEPDRPGLTAYYIFASVGSTSQTGMIRWPSVTLIANLVCKDLPIVRWVKNFS